MSFARRLAWLTATIGLSLGVCGFGVVSPTNFYVVGTRTEPIQFGGYWSAPSTPIKIFAATTDPQNPYVQIGEAFTQSTPVYVDGCDTPLYPFATVLSLPSGDEYWQGIDDPQNNSFKKAFVSLWANGQSPMPVYGADGFSPHCADITRVCAGDFVDKCSEKQPEITIQLGGAEPGTRCDVGGNPLLCRFNCVANCDLVYGVALDLFSADSFYTPGGAPRLPLDYANTPPAQGLSPEAPWSLQDIGLKEKGVVAYGGSNNVALLLKRGENRRDVAVSAEIGGAGGLGSQGLIARHWDDDTYYMLKVTPYTASLLRYENGSPARTLTKSTAFSLSSLTSVELDILDQTDRDTFGAPVPSGACTIKVYVGGVLYIVANDDCSNVPMGGYGIFAAPGSTAYFTSLEATPYSAPAEVCDGVDNDGNGYVDEFVKVCDPGYPTGCTTSCGSIGTATCSSTGCGWSGPCTPPIEACNGVDDDCDGQIDEGYVCDDGLYAPLASGTFHSNYPWNYNMGYKFTPGRTLTVEALGGRFSGTKTVYLFNTAAGSVLRSATVTGSYSVFSYTPITALKLSAGTSYTASVWLAGSGGAYYSSAGLPKVSREANATINASCYRPSSTSEPCGYASTTIYMYGVADVRYANACSHAEEVLGPALVDGCSVCSGIVCDSDSYCCNTTWDSICVNEVASWCP